MLTRLSVPTGESYADLFVAAANIVVLSYVCDV